MIMLAAARRVVRVARTEGALAVRSRRLLVVMLLFAAFSGFAMYGTVSFFAGLEQHLVEALKLPPSETAGSVTMALWKSEIFVRIVSSFVGDSLVFGDIRGEHPILLAYAMFLFQTVAFLTLMVSAPRVADDVRSGAARYWLVRVTRVEWSLGKYVGESLGLGAAILVGAVAAGGVLFARLPAKEMATLLPSLLAWSLRAWVYAFGWLGVYMGLSHVVRSGGKATALSLLSFVLGVALPSLLSRLAAVESVPDALVHLDLLSPSASWSLLWRRSPSALLQGVVQLSAVSLFYLSLGAAVFDRRDV